VLVGYVMICIPECIKTLLLSPYFIIIIIIIIINVVKIPFGQPLRLVW